MAARYAVTTGNWTGAIWAATSGGAAGSAAVPTSADTVTINKNVVVTLDNTTPVCSTIAASVGTTSGDSGGKLIASTSANSKLTIENGGTFSGSTGGSGAYSSTFEIDLSAHPTITCDIVINNVNGGAGTGSTLRLDGNFVIKGAQKTRNTTINSALVANTTTSVVVADATGWAVGDQLIFATTSAYNSPPRVDAVTIATITPGTGTTATITWTDGAGTGGAVLYGHDSGCPVGNLTSNVVFRPGTAGGYATLRLSPSANVNSVDCYCQDVEFRQMKTSAGGNLYTLFGSTRVVSLNRLAFNRFSLVAFYQQNDGAGPGDRNDFAFYSTQTSSDLTASGFWSSTAGGFDPGNDVGWHVYGGGGGLRGVTPGTKLTNAKISGTVIGSSSGQAGAYNYSEINDTDIWGCNTGVLSGDYKSNNLRLGSAVFTNSNNSTGISVQPGTMTATNLNVQSSSNIGGILDKNIIGEVRLWNRDDDLAIQEVFKRHSNTTPVLQRDAAPPTSGGNPQSTSALLFTLNSTSQADWTFDVVVKAGETVNIFTRAMKSGTPAYGASTLPKIAVYDAGTLVTSDTMSGGTAADTWETLTVSATNSGSTDTVFQVVLSAQSATAGAKAWFAGLPASPFVTRCRWYGYRFNETSPTRTVDPSSGLYLASPVTESTAAGYTGISIAWDTVQSDITISADQTFQKLYDFHQADSLANVGDLVALTAAGVAGSISLFAAGDITINTGYKLNGSGSISMDTFTLTTEFAGANPYTYTGGTWTQATTIPNFSGGTLVIGDTGTYVFDTDGSVEIHFTPTGPGTYSMASVTAGTALDLRNDTAHAITVELSSEAAALATTVNNTGGTITISAPVLYQSVTVTGLTANSRVQLYDTTNSVEEYNDVVAGTSFTWTSSNPASTDGERVMRIRVAYVNGTNAKNFIEATIGTLGITDGTESISYLVAQTADAVYEANAIDGSTVNTPSTIISIVDSTFLVEVDTGSISLPTIYAYQCYWLYDAVGIQDEGSFITAIDTANYRFSQFKIKNVSSPTAPLVITGGYAVDDTTGDAIDIIDTTGGTIFLTPNHVVPYAAGAEATVATVQAGLTAQGYTGTRASKIDNINTNVPLAALGIPGNE